MEVVGHPVILDDAPVFRLVLGHDAIGTVRDSLPEMARFPCPRVLRAVRGDDRRGYPQPERAVDTALTAMIMLLIGVEGMDLITQEVRFFMTRMRDEGLRFAEL